MPSLAATALRRIAEAWGRTTPLQRWLFAGLASALAAAVAVAAYLNRPDWVVLISQADPKDAAEVAAKLQELRVPYQPTGDGYTILVPRSELYTARLALAQANLPRGSSVGLELFEQPKFGATEFDRKVTYLRALQGELERALTRIAEVQYANVKLAIPERSVFVREQQPVTAAVLVQPRPGKRLSNEQVQGIVNFLANSVQGLKPENVTVVDHTGRLLSRGGDLPAEQAEASVLELQEQMKASYEHSLQTLLEPIFGAGNVVARVHLELSQEASRTEVRSVGNSVPKQTETSRELVQGAAQNGQGRAAQPGAPPTYQAQLPAGAEDQWKTRTVTTYEVGEEKRVVLTPPGAVKRISVGVAINRTDLAPEQIQQVKEMVAGATGAAVADVSVTAVPFSRQEREGIPSRAPGQGQTVLALVLAAAAALLLAGAYLAWRRRRQAEAEELQLGLPAARSLAEVAAASLDTLVAAPSPAASQGQEAGGAGAAAVPGGTPGPGGAVPGTGLGPAAAQPPAGSPAGSGKTAEEHRDSDILLTVKKLVEEDPEAAAAMVSTWLKGG